MTPYQRGKLAHDADTDNDPFEEVLVAHFLTGIVVSTPDVFLLARPVDSRGDHMGFNDPFLTYDEPDTWHVYLGAGDITKLADFFPYPLPTVSFVRKNSLHFYRLAPRSEIVNRIKRYGRKEETRSGATESESTRSNGAETTEQAGRSLEPTGETGCCR